MSWTSTLLPVAGMPMKPPSLVPVYFTRATTLAPLAKTSSHVDVQVGERRKLHPEELLDPFFRRRKAGRHLVLDEIVCQMLGERADISGVDRVVQTPRSGRVIHVF